MSFHQVIAAACNRIVNGSLIPCQACNYTWCSKLAIAIPLTAWSLTIGRFRTRPCAARRMICIWLHAWKVIPCQFCPHRQAYCQLNRT